MAAFENFKIWYAKSLGSNAFASADTNRRIQNTTDTDKAISLISCTPQIFAKRVTDVSTALAVDPTSPDTGTGMSDVIIRFTEERTIALTASALEKLLEMFYQLSSDDVFLARFGLENTDNSRLDCLPIATAGYKFKSFRQEPNQNTPGIQTYEVVLKFVGDHTKLNTRST